MSTEIELVRELVQLRQWPVEMPLDARRAAYDAASALFVDELRSEPQVLDVAGVAAERLPAVAGPARGVVLYLHSTRASARQCVKAATDRSPCGGCESRSRKGGERQLDIPTITDRML